MSTINDYLDDDVMTIIFDRIDTPKDWRSVSLVCNRWGEVCSSEYLQNKKGRQFSRMDMKTQQVWGTTDEGERYTHQTSTMYFYLPNNQLHGKYETIETKRLLPTRELISETRTVKRFQFGSKLPGDHIEFKVKE